MRISCYFPTLLLVVNVFGVCIVSLAGEASAKACTPVSSKAQCSAKNACLKCGTASAYDCIECCPGCSLVKKDGYQWCSCKGPAPGPKPGGNDTWTNYTVAGMDVMAVVGGPKGSSYEKVIVMLHGGGSSGEEFVYNYDSGWFGNITGKKFVFPTSPDNGLWYRSFKNGCGLLDDCAYDLNSIAASASRVAALIEHEKALLASRDAASIYLAGFSQGGQLTSYMQLAKLTYALGGAIIMDGFPLPPLVDMPGASPDAAKRNASYYGDDMRFMIYQGAADPIFPAHLLHDTFAGIFQALDITSTLKVNVTEPGMTHTTTKEEFDAMLDFINNE